MEKRRAKRGLEFVGCMGLAGGGEDESHLWLSYATFMSCASKQKL